MHFVHARAEDFGQNPSIVKNLILLQHERLHDYLYLAELCVPLVKKGGIFIAMKGAAAEDELVDAEKALTVLGATIKEEYSFILPIENSERNIFVFNKVKNTPKKYPRKPGIPNKTPIQ